jgi:hypothetical protein
MDHYIHFCEYQYKKEEIIDFEVELFLVLKFKLFYVTPYCIMNRLIIQ